MRLSVFIRTSKFQPRLGALNILPIWISIFFRFCSLVVLDKHREYMVKLDVLRFYLVPLILRLGPGRKRGSGRKFPFFKYYWNWLLNNWLYVPSILWSSFVRLVVRRWIVVRLEQVVRRLLQGFVFARTVAHFPRVLEQHWIEFIEG